MSREALEKNLWEYIKTDMLPNLAMNFQNNQESTLSITTVVQLSQAIASELTLSELLPNLIHIFLKHTHAQIGCLLMEKAGEWVIEVSAQSRSQKISITSLLQSIPITHALPQSIIHYVADTQTSVIANTTKTSEFAGDSYIQLHYSQSILCVPLLHQGQLKGILYLENRDNRYFSTYHSTLVETLSVQVAIALTHAQIYTQTKERESQLAQLLNALPVGVAMHDTTGKIVCANPVALQLAGGENSQTATISEISQAYQLYRGGTEEPYPTDELPIVRALAGETLKIDDMVLCQGDRAIALEVVSTPIYNEQGQIVYALCAMQDITERQQAAANLRQSQATIQQQLTEIEAIYASIPIGLCFMDTNLRYARINEHLAKINGLSVQEHIGRRISEVIPEIGNEIESIHLQVIQSGLPILDRETHGTTPAEPGIEKDWLSSYYPLKGNDGQVLGVNVTVQDITERKQAELALKESEERFRQLAENIDAVFWMRTKDNFQVLYVSQAYTRICGRSAIHLFQDGQSFFNIVHPEDLDTVKEAMPNSDNSFDLEYRIIRPDGEIRWLRDRSFPIRNIKGEIYRYAGIAEDITERKQTDAKIREQATLIDISTDAILVQDLENRILFWNESAKRLYGWTASEVIGKNAPQILFKVDETAPIAQEIQPEILNKGAWQGELSQVTKDGKTIIVASRWTLVHDDKGQPKSILVTNTDITEKKQIEAKFLRAQRLESIGTLASGIAHDLNNVLSPISMSLELLDKKLSDPQSRQLLKMLDTNVKRGAALIKQVLSFSRGVSGKRMIIQIKHIVSEIQYIIQQTFPKSIEFSTNIAPDLWTVYADATQLNQVIMNLCINARDAMPKGGCLRVLAKNLFLDESSVQRYPEAQVGCYVTLAVADTGIGISPEILERIFEPFFTTKDIGKGTGLGLSTVIGIIKNHGGFINVESTPGKGSQFQVYLPAVTGQQSQPQATQDIPKGNGELILVVDDEKSIRDMAQVLLLNYNYKILTANNGVDAIALYIQHKTEISVVLVDMMMPDMDGITTIQTLNKINPSAKIIASSGLLSSDKLTEVASAGIKAFLPKPYTLPELLRTIHLVISH